MRVRRRNFLLCSSSLPFPHYDPARSSRIGATNPFEKMLFTCVSLPRFVCTPDSDAHKPLPASFARVALMTTSPPSKLWGLIQLGGLTVLTMRNARRALGPSFFTLFYPIKHLTLFFRPFVSKYLAKLCLLPFQRVDPIALRSFNSLLANKTCPIPSAPPPRSLRYLPFELELPLQLFIQNCPLETRITRKKLVFRFETLFFCSPEIGK